MVHVVLKRSTHRGVDTDAGQDRDELTARTEQQVDEPGPRRGHVPSDDQHLVTGDAEPVAGSARARPRQRLLGGDAHRTVSGTRGRAGHGVPVVDGLTTRVVHRQRRQSLHHRARRHRHDVDAPADRCGTPGDQLLGGDVSVGQHHDLGGRRIDERPK